MSRFMKASGGLGEGMAIRMMAALRTPEYAAAFSKVASLAAERVRANSGTDYLRSVGGWTKLIEGLLRAELGEVDPQTNSLGVPTNAQWWIKSALEANVGRIRTEAQRLL